MLKKWLIYTTVGIFLGFLLGFVILWIWSLIRSIFQGYGDSGPSWIIIVNNLIIYGGILTGITIGQVLLYKKWHSKSNKNKS
jgi:hypothetical protein